MNKVILMGRLTRDPEMRQTASGLPVARFTIAVNRRFAKEGQQNADFISCVAWRQTAEFIQKYFRKGNMLAVVGSIQTGSYTNNQGQKVYTTEVLIDEAYFTGEKSGNASCNNYGGNSGYGDNSGYDGGFNEISPEDEEDLPF